MGTCLFKSSRLPVGGNVQFTPPTQQYRLLWLSASEGFLRTWEKNQEKKKGEEKKKGGETSFFGGNHFYFLD